MAEQRDEDRPVSTARMVAMLYGSRIRSQATFRTSFLADLLGQVLIVGTEFLELWVILTQVGTLGGMTLPQVAVVYGLGALSLLLAITVAFLADMMVNLAAFWLVETRGLTVVYNATMNLLSGFLIPIVWFPDWLLAIARATPFPSMIQTPIDTLSGRVPPPEALGLIGVQIGWAAVLALAAWAMLRAGTRSLEVQGG